MKRLLLSLALIAFAAQAVKTGVFTIPTKAYTGAISMPPTPISVGVIGLNVSLDTSQWSDPATSATMVFDCSFDGGVNWLLNCAGSARVGGVLVDRQGVPLVPQPAWEIGVPLPDPTNPNRQLRGTITIVGTVTTGGTVSVVQ